MDIAAMNSHLEASYGPNRATARPSTHEYALFYGDPNFGGVELSGGGYARVAVDGDTDWLPADGGAMSTVWLSLPAASGAYDSTITHWALIYNDGGDVIDDSGPIDGDRDITSAGAAPQIRATVRFANSIDPEEV